MKGIVVVEALNDRPVIQAGHPEGVTNFQAAVCLARHNCRLWDFVAASFLFTAQYTPVFGPRTSNRWRNCCSICSRVPSLRFNVFGEKVLARFHNLLCAKNVNAFLFRVLKVETLFPWRDMFLDSFWEVFAKTFKRENCLYNKKEDFLFMKMVVKNVGKCSLRKVLLLFIHIFLQMLLAQFSLQTPAYKIEDKVPKCA